MASVEQPGVQAAVQPGVRSPAPGSLRLVQDLVNTVDREDDADGLRKPEQLAAWAGQLGIAGPGFDAAGLRAVLVLREALRDVCQAHAGVDVPPGTLAALDELLGGAPLRLAIDAEGAARVVPASGLTGPPALTARVAAAVAEAVAEGTWPRLKACAADTCRWVYYDRSPSGRGRWCTMSVCGSRAKMRAYRSRTR